MAADLDERIEATLIALLAARSPASSISPSEVARALAPHDEAAWRALMPRVRTVAARLAARGQLRITRRGATLDPERLGRGPIRLHAPDSGPIKG